jgi:hypothetical protein
MSAGDAPMSSASRFSQRDLHDLGSTLRPDMVGVRRDCYGRRIDAYISKERSPHVSALSDGENQIDRTNTGGGAECL